MIFRHSVLMWCDFCCVRYAPDIDYVLGYHLQLFVTLKKIVFLQNELIFILLINIICCISSIVHQIRRCLVMSADIAETPRNRVESTGRCIGSLRNSRQVVTYNNRDLPLSPCSAPQMTGISRLIDHGNIYWNIIQIPTKHDKRRSGVVGVACSCIASSPS